MQDVIASAAERVHGAFDYSELERLGLCADELLDFSANINPYGPSPAVRAALRETAIERYPDRKCLELRRALLQHELSAAPVTLDRLVCGNGTAELIWTIARTYLHPGQKAAIVGPTFGEYHAASQAAGARVIHFQTSADTQFRLNIAELISWLQREQPALFWLCNPNNPTGTWLARSCIEAIAEICRQLQIMLVIDEAYWHFLFPRETFSALDLCEPERALPLIVLRSLTKDCALAGLRLGYAATSSLALARALNAQLPPWNVNSFAQQAGIAALRDRAHLATTLAQLERERQAFFGALAEADLQVFPSRAHFSLIAVGDGAAVRQQLLARHLLVRDCASFGLPYAIRVVTRPREDWQRLVGALKEIVK
jgi:histidinol-phosphate aminotransferase